MKDNLREYFGPLFISCKFLGIWPTSFREKDSIFDYTCGVPINIFFWYMFYKNLNSRQLLRKELTKASWLFNEIYIHFGFLASIFLVVYNFLNRHRIKRMFGNLEYFEKVYFYNIKKRNLKLNLFIFVFIAVIVVAEYNLIMLHYIESFNVTFYFSYMASMWIHIFYMFVICEVLYITRNMFNRLNELLLALSDRHMNMNYISPLLKIHFDLTRFTNDQNYILAVFILIIITELFLRYVNGIYYCLGLLAHVMLSQKTAWPLASNNLFFGGNSLVLLICLCHSWTVIKEEVNI